MPALKLYLMGRFHLTRHDQPLDGFRSQRARALLAYLVVEHARPLHRTQLADLLWDSYEPDAARTNLRVSLSNLRQLLAPFDPIRATYHTVQFDVTRPDFWCDVLALEAATGATKLGSGAAPAAEAGPFYEREFLEGLDAIDSPPFQAWLQRQRTRYRQLLEWLGPADGATLACSYFDRTVQVWDRTGNHLYRLRGHQDPVRTLAYSPDGDLLATASDDRTVRLWDMRTGGLIHTLHGHTNLVRTLAFHSQGALLASGSYDHTVQLWDVFTGQHREPLERHTGPIMHLSMNPDGTLLATGSEDQTIRLWEVSTGQLRFLLSGHTDFVRWVAFSPDGALLASCSNDKTVRLWHVASGQLLHTLEGHTAFVHTVLYGSDGTTLVSAGADRTVRIWGLDPAGGRWELRHIFDAAIYKYSCVALSPDGSTLVVGGMDMCVRLWDVQTGQLLRTLAGHSNLVTAVEFDPTGYTVVSSSSDGAVRIWDLPTGQCLHVLRPEGPYAGMDISGVTGISEAQKAALLALGAVASGREL